jgi:hypothetical protein
MKEASRGEGTQVRHSNAFRSTPRVKPCGRQLGDRATTGQEPPCLPRTTRKRPWHSRGFLAAMSRDHHWYGFRSRSSGFHFRKSRECSWLPHPLPERSLHSLDGIRSRVKGDKGTEWGPAVKVLPSYFGRCDTLISLRENAIGKEPGSSYLQKRLAFSRAGAHLFARDGEGVIHVWDLRRIRQGWPSWNSTGTPRRCLLPPPRAPGLRSGS